MSDTVARLQVDFSFNSLGAPSLHMQSTVGNTNLGSILSNSDAPFQLHQILSG